MNAVYGGVIGPSALSSIDAPCTKFPAAIMTCASYPGISSAIGTASESTGAAFWIIRQNSDNFPGDPNVTVCTMSERFASKAGDVS